MNKTTLVLLVAGALAAGEAAAQTTGYVGATLLNPDVNSRNRFRFEEYRDLSPGLSLELEAKSAGERYFWSLFGENLGRDDQLITLKGGRYDQFKYAFTNNNIIHNLTFGAITPFGPVGSGTLSYPGAAAATPTTNTALWNKFDYEIKHENLGGSFEWTAMKPWYFRAAANQKETRGLRPLGVPFTSPGGPFAELPMVIDYTTTDASAEIGYATRSAQYSANLSWSRFDDHNDFLLWRNPAFTGSATPNERSTISSDNNFWKLGLNAVWKQLPLTSTLALRGTYSKLTNSIPVQTIIITPPATLRAANPNVGTFNGDVENTTFSGSLTSQPLRALDSRLYYNFWEKKNHSTQVVFTPTGGNGCDFNPVTGVAIAGNQCSNELFHYRKHNAGIDLQYRINRANKLSGGWDYAETLRERHDFNKTEENKFYAELKNSSIDWLTGRVKVQHLNRRSDFGFSGINPAANAVNFFNFHLKRYDVSNADQSQLKVALDATPMPHLDLGAEATSKRTRYPGAALGRTKDTREELYLSAVYGDPSRFRVSAFWDHERTRYDSTHWQGAVTAATNPAVASSATAFPWKSKVKDKNYVIGLGADWPLTGQLKLKGSVIWQETDGTLEFSTNNAFAGFVPLINIPNYDSFRRTALDLKAIYAINKEFEATLGFAHENYRLDDVQMNNYNYTQVASGQNFLSGAYAFSSYNANLVYLTLKYRWR